ncbi:MAG: histidine ammonia-lyase [Bacteroidales bacterium]
MKIHEISPEPLSFNVIKEIIDDKAEIRVSQRSLDAIEKCRRYLHEKMEKQHQPIYGINTGFGSLYDVSVSNEDLSQLQENLVKSHACGTGDKMDIIMVKLMMLLKIHALSLGNSGVFPDTVIMLSELYNRDIIPVVFELGSLGASGDLAPLAHMVLPVLGMGEVYYRGKCIKASEALAAENLKPIKLAAKEGLAMLNGTQFMAAYGVYSLLRIQKLSELANIIAAISLEAFDGSLAPFYEGLHSLRPHKGQIYTARYFRDILRGSEMIGTTKNHVQDPYSFRCIPQVHGATQDAVDHVTSVVLTEINSVTDNPTIFPDDDQIISGGNFHGQPLALAYDYLAMALAELGNISERRSYQLLSGKRDLPHFLVANPGLNSGFMIPQYTAASIVNQNKQLSMPCSVDSIESSQGQEDHVSMGANSATKMYKVVINLERILAIELFIAAQAFDFRKGKKSSKFIEDFVSDYRKKVNFIKNDKIMYEDIDKTVKYLQNVDIDTLNKT